MNTEELRIEFAKAALTGLLASEAEDPDNPQRRRWPSAIADRAFDIAQAMIDENARRIAEDQQEAGKP